MTLGEVIDSMDECGLKSRLQCSVLNFCPNLMQVDMKAIFLNPRRLTSLPKIGSRTLTALIRAAELIDSSISSNELKYTYIPHRHIPDSNEIRMTTDGSLRSKCIKCDEAIVVVQWRSMKTLA